MHTKGIYKKKILQHNLNKKRIDNSFIYLFILLNIYLYPILFMGFGFCGFVYKFLRLWFLKGYNNKSLKLFSIYTVYYRKGYTFFYYNYSIYALCFQIYKYVKKLNNGLLVRYFPTTFTRVDHFLTYFKSGTPRSKSFLLKFIYKILIFLINLEIYTEIYNIFILLFNVIL